MNEWNVPPGLNQPHCYCLGYKEQVYHFLSNGVGHTFVASVDSWAIAHCSQSLMRLGDPSVQMFRSRKFPRQ